MTRKPGDPGRRATVWTTSIMLSLMVALVPFARSSSDHQQSAATTPATASTPTPSSPLARESAALEAAVDHAVSTATGSASVTVQDLSTGKTRSYGATGHSFDAASIVKVDIVSALLLQAQDEGRRLTDAEKALAAGAIKSSDNAAATALFHEVGGRTGLEAANKRLGLTETRIGANGYWGLTRTTSADQVRLLAQVFTGRSALSGDSRAYVRSLMGAVDPSQRFGVSVASADPAHVQVKVGWLQRDTTGLWVVNSIGRAERGGHSYLVAVLSDGNTTFDGGVEVVDAVAEAAVNAG